MKLPAHSKDRAMKRQTISHSPHFVPYSSERRVDLDWVRIGAFGLLIFYHLGMLYVSWGFHIKSVHRITALEPLMLVLNPAAGAAFSGLGRRDPIHVAEIQDRAASSFKIHAAVDPTDLRNARDRAAAGL
jgi:hypothetical protein